MIDHFTRWPEAIPNSDISVETASKVFYNTWITLFGVPSKIITDSGWQFESSLFKSLIQLLSIQNIRLSLHHVQANCLVEEFRRPQKQTLKAYNTDQ